MTSDTSNDAKIAQGHISALEKLIDSYAMIGEAMPRFDRLSAAFKDDTNFQSVMGHFYEDILEFHRRGNSRFISTAILSLTETKHTNFSANAVSQNYTPVFNGADQIPKMMYSLEDGV